MLKQKPRINNSEIFSRVRHLPFLLFRNHSDVSVEITKKSRECLEKILFHCVSFLAPLIEKNST